MQRSSEKETIRKKRYHGSNIETMGACQKIFAELGKEKNQVLENRKTYSDGIKTFFPDVKI